MWTERNYSEVFPRRSQKPSREDARLCNRKLWKWDGPGIQTAFPRAAFSPPLCLAGLMEGAACEQGLGTLVISSGCLLSVPPCPVLPTSYPSCRLLPHREGQCQEQECDLADSGPQVSLLGASLCI